MAEPNAAFMDMITAVGHKPGQVLLKVTVGKGGFICGVPVPNTVVGAAKVTIYARGGASFQLNELFEKYPALRPVVRQRCTPIFTKKADGTPCMLIGLKTGKDHPVVPRTSSKKEKGA